MSNQAPTSKANLCLVERYTDARAVQYLSDASKTDSVCDIAQFLGIHNAHIYRALNDGYISPKLKDALVGRGVLMGKPKRRRFACDIPPDFTPAQADELRRRLFAAYEVTIEYMRRRDDG